MVALMKEALICVKKLHSPKVKSFGSFLFWCKLSVLLMISLIAQGFFSISYKYVICHHPQVIVSTDVNNYFANKVCLVKAMVSPVVMYGCELAYKESWVPNWCFWTVVLEKTLESPLDCKEIQPVHPKGDQSWVFIGRTDVEAETLIPWPPDAKNWLTGKAPDTGQDWR